MNSVYFEDLSVGDRFQTGWSNPITPDVVERYFDLTGDRFNIHRDSAFARSFGLREAMVPGNLVTAIATGLVFASGHFADSLVVQARKDVRFVQPLYLNERVRVTETVTSLEDRPNKRYAKVTLERLVENESGAAVQRIDQEYRIVKREGLALLVSNR